MEIVFNAPTYTNFKSEKGTGQVIKRNSALGFEMNFSPNHGEGEIQYFPTKTEAKNELKKRLG